MPSLAKNFPKQAAVDLSYPFTTASDGLYAIAVDARCQSAKQIGAIGEDLHVEIDGRQFRELPPVSKSQYYNIPPAWNGTELKGLKKTVIFIIRLTSGEHSLKFIPRGGAIIEQEPEIKFIGNLSNLKFDIAQRAEDGDRRPWLTFVLVELPLQTITADASVGWHWRDGDDVKLIVDGQIKPNSKSRFHRDWLWSAGFWQLFGAKRESKSVTVNLPRGVHYVEFWADRTPTLHLVSLDLGPAGAKRVPTREDPLTTDKNFLDDDDQMILARLIFGEAEDQSVEAKIWVGSAALNRVRAKAWPNTVREVILQEGQYDPFKTDDKNYKKIIDPLLNAGQGRKNAWYQSYDIGESLLAGEIKNPTTATHFHGRGVDKDWFILNIVPKGKFLKQIDDSFFYWSPN